MFDGSVSIRRTCEQPATELVCDDDDPSTDGWFGDRRASVTADLSPGTYYVVVDSFPDSQGDFDVSARLVTH